MTNTIEFIKQCKGLDADKLNIADDEMFYESLKYDGVYIQIQKHGDLVSFFTSSGKEFACRFSEYFRKFDFNFKIETEYICDGGKLGTRAKADNEIKKVVKNSSFELTGQFVVTDIIGISKDSMLRDMTSFLFEERLLYFLKFTYFEIEDYMPFFTATNSLISYSNAKKKLEVVADSGREGLFLKSPSHTILIGKKVKNAVKLKKKLTADLTCTGWDGIYLLLQDDDGLTAKVPCSGMQDYISLGDVVEIEYEQIINTYNIPVFKRVRDDK